MPVSYGIISAIFSNIIRPLYMHGTITALNGMIGTRSVSCILQKDIKYILFWYSIVWYISMYVLSRYVKYTFILRYATCMYVWANDTWHACCLISRTNALNRFYTTEPLSFFISLFFCFRNWRRVFFMDFFCWLRGFPVLHIGFSYIQDIIFFIFTYICSHS